MRISDWSSDVCSSDLGRGSPGEEDVGGAIEQHQDRHVGQAPGASLLTQVDARGDAAHVADLQVEDHQVGSAGSDRRSDLGAGAHRSEEHTSELQSLMRLSYAVFCLDKKQDKPDKTPYEYEEIIDIQ